MLKGFDDYFNHTQYRVPYPRVTKERLQFLCEEQWLHMGVGWLPEGTFNSQIIDDLFSMIAANGEKYPNQYQYIDQWGDAVAEKADDLLQCQAEMVRLCVARPTGKKLRVVSKRFKDMKISETKLSNTKKEVLVAEEEVVLRPPPYVLPPPLLPHPLAAAATAQGDGQPVVRKKQRRKVAMAPKVEEEHSVAESGEPSEGEDEG